MVDMFKMANIFQTNHRNGTVSNVTDYSFKFTTTQKNDKVKRLFILSRILRNYKCKQRKKETIKKYRGDNL